MLWLEGEAGAGKTLLLAALRERARAQGAHVLNARGGPLEQGYAWGAVRQLLEALLRDPGGRRGCGLGRHRSLGAVVDGWCGR